MRAERSPTRGLLRETVTIADLAVRLGLTLEDTYELCRAHGVRARPADHADQPRRRRPPPAGALRHVGIQKSAELLTCGVGLRQPPCMIATCRFACST
jgi:hypothetical protein